MSDAFLGAPLETDNFRHVEFKLPEFSKMARANTSAFKAAGSAYFDPRWKDISRHLKSNPVIPADVQDEAARHSRDLVFSMSEMRSRIVRGQSHGSLDSSRLARLAAPGLSSREFERLAATAYRRREHVRSDTARPRIAIVADMNNDIRSKNPLYMKMLGRLAYIVAEAAKLSGVEVALYASRGFYVHGAIDPSARKLAHKHFNSLSTKRPHVVMTAKDWDTDIDGSDYAMMTDTVPGMIFSNPVPLFQAFHQVTHASHGMQSNCGAGGVEFARAQGANVVIAFGDFDPSETPDIRFDPAASVDDVVRGIVDTLGNREAA